VEPGRRGMLGVPGVNRLLISRSRSFDFALAPERGTQPESFLRVYGLAKGGPVPLEGLREAG
jgi:hypothetical protein